MAFRPAQNTHRLLSAAASQNPTLVNDRASLVQRITGFNAGAITYLKLYDKATAPGAGDTPRKTLYIAANTMFDFAFGDGMTFGSGFGYRMTAAAADADATNVAAAAVLALNIDYS